MNAKTLKYNHVHNCPANKFKDPKQPEQEITKHINDLEEIKPPSARENRISKRENIIKHKISQAF